ncbi:MAG: ornithine cyclodeaminase family protein, partial [Ideonella sp.]|nr:ornithine cyclodeaminase family protein [Ideonella sp.]
MHLHDAAATRAALPFERLVPALRAMFAAGCEVPPRHVHEVGSGHTGPPFTSLIMPAWVPGRHYGVKTINIAPGNTARGLPGLHAVYLLFDGATGVPLALIDGDELTTRRTAATSALAASWLARADARHLLVVGGGRIARWLPEAHRTVRPIDRVTVWTRHAPQREALAATLRADGIEARAT